MWPALKTQLSTSSLSDENAPAWIKEEIFLNLLYDEFKDFQKINKFTVKAVSGVDESDNIQKWQINIQMQLKDDKIKATTYIIKTTLEGRKESSLEQECFIYNELLPAFEALYKEAGKPIQFAPNNYKLSQSVKDLIGTYVLYEELQTKGYKQATSKDGLNMKQVEAVLEKLAAFHAASVVYYEKEKRQQLPKIFKETKAAVRENEQDLEIVLKRKFHECLRNYDLREYQDQIKSYQVYVTQTLPKLAKLDTNAFNVLQHGNCFFNNLLLNLDAFGNVKQLLLVNFQGCHYGSPAKDLFDFLLSSARLSDKLLHFDYYIKYYHDHLTANLQLLKYAKTVPKLTELHISLLHYSCLGFVSIAKLLPVVLLSSGTIVDIDLRDFIAKATCTQMLRSLYENPRYAQEMQQILPWLENRGYLEE